MLKLENINICYDREILNQSKIEIFPGGISLIEGKSGTGKTTLLYHIGLICNDTNFIYSLDGVNIDLKNEKEISFFRRNMIGYVLQESNLFEQYNVGENLRHFAMLTNEEVNYQDILSLVDLDIDLNERIESLSGGERQRLAIACALIKKPKILIMDEPTSALDKKNEINIFKTIQKIAEKLNIYVIVASHSQIAKDYAMAIYRIENKTIHVIQSNKNNDFSLKIEKTTVLSKTFYKNYVQHFQKHYKQLSNIMKMIFSIVMVSIFITSQLIDIKLEQNIQSLNELSDKQIFVTSHKENLYLDNPVYQTDNLSNKALKSLKGVQNIYPVYSLKTKIDGIEYTIVPYFNENNIDKAIVQMVNKQMKNGIYCSINTFNKLKIDEIQFDFGNEGSYNQKFKIKGYLQNSYVCGFLKNQTEYLYINYDELSQLNQSLHLDNHFIGYTIFFNDINSMNKGIEDLKTSYFVNETFQKNDVLESLVEQTYMTKIEIVSLICAVAIILLFIVLKEYEERRKLEFALLKINGLSNREIMKIIGIELLRFHKTNMFVFVLLLIMSIVLKMNFSYFLVFLIIINQCLLILICYLHNFLSVKKISPDKILRF